MEEGDERAAAGEPDGGLAGRVAAADDRDARAGAELGLGGPGGVEDRQSLELRKAVDRWPPVLSTRREQDGTRCDLAVLLEADEVTSVPRFEGEGAVRRCRARVELPRLADCAARQLRAADTRWEAEIVLDSSRRPGLAAERGALDDERLEPFGGAVDRGSEPRRAGAHDQQVDLFARCELEPDPDRAQYLAGGWAVQLSSAGQSHERQRAALGRGGIFPRVREPVRARKLEHPHRWLGAVRADDLEADPLHALQRLAAGDEGGEDEVAERAVLVEERPQRGALDRDVPQRLGHERVDEDRLPRQEAQLPEEARGAMPDQHVPGSVDDRDLPFEDCNERVGPIADPVQQFTDRRRALLADLGQSR